MMMILKRIQRFRSPHKPTNSDFVAKQSHIKQTNDDNYRGKKFPKTLPGKTVMFTRFPVKPLFRRFRYVCHPHSSDLVRSLSSHYHTIQNNNKGSVLVKYTSQQREHCFSILSTSVKKGGEHVLTHIEHLEIPLTRRFMHDLVVLGPCNGLFCLYDGLENIALWNPATGDFKALPWSLAEPPPGAEYYTGYYNLGFGFDQKTSDYKVLRFVNNMIETDLVDRVELYSLRNDSWREIPHLDNVLTRHIPCLDDNYGVSHNGVCHWQAVDSDGKRFILSFDVADEVFEKFPLPDLDGYDYYNSQHAILNGLPAVVFVKLEASEKCLDIWTMSKQGRKKSWVKLPSIGPFSGIHRPLGFWKNGELFWENVKRQLVLYDPSTQLVKNLQLGWCNNTLQVLNCVENFVPNSWW